MTNAEFEQLALQQQPCSAVWIRCLDNLANVYDREHDDVGSYIIVLQTAVLVPEGAHHARYTHTHSYRTLHTINKRVVHDVHAWRAVARGCIEVAVTHVLWCRLL